MKYLPLMLGVAAILAGCDSRPSTSVQTPAPSPVQTQAPGLTKEDREEIATMVSERLQAARDGQPAPAPISDAEFEERVRREVAAVLEKERQENQRQENAPPRSDQPANSPEQTPQPQSQYKTVSSNTPASGYDRFYNELTPYGKWYEDSEYGYIWQPSIANSPDWRPYLDGQWIYTDEGWNWVSNEPFGWATYHYGRWTDLDGIGWVWVPGSEWAPAWVSWRNDEENIGWAPLPPRSNYVSVSYSVGPEVDSYYDIGPGAYCFVPVVRFGAASYRGIVLPREQNIRIVERTRNVTRITVVNRRVRCDGPDFEFVRVRSREPIRHCRIVESDDRNRFDKVRPVAIYKGNDIEVYAPRINVNVNVNNNIRPKNVDRKIVNKTEKTGWEIVKNEQDKARIHESMAKSKDATVVHYDAPNRNNGPKLQDNNGPDKQKQDQNREARLTQPPRVEQQQQQQNNQHQELNRQEKQERERQERQSQNELENRKRQQAAQQQQQQLQAEEQQRQRQRAEQQQQQERQRQHQQQQAEQEQENQRQRQQAEQQQQQQQQQQQERQRQRQQQQAEQEQENQRQRQQAEQQQQQQQQQRQQQQQQPQLSDGQQAKGGGKGNKANDSSTEDEDAQGKGRNRNKAN